MFDIAVNVLAPVVGPDAGHQDCTCVGVVIALPDGALKLYAERADELEALGWGILAEVERRKRQPALTGAELAP